MNRWPIHPKPMSYEILSSWIGRIADAHYLSFGVFCRKALGIEPKDIHNLDSLPSSHVLTLLSEGTGVPVAQLQTMTLAGIFGQLGDAIQQLIEENPEEYKEMLEMFRKTSQNSVTG